MTDKLKKQIIRNLPYLIFVYLFNKLCQGVRLSPGADASEKLLHIGQGFSAAFASLAPSFHLVDLCVGAAGAVLIRLVVYSKGKNAKKYRKRDMKRPWLRDVKRIMLRKMNRVPRMNGILLWYSSCRIEEKKRALMQYSILIYFISEKGLGNCFESGRYSVLVDV